ncbi:type I restriction endonuclease subunit R [Wohlfahrtiimonas chitiniclastica]|uniref:type I restriction endonuclease subunit R n=1 Tax=Wohlfahrtiimonas chitiniclastica TaxID=400946 RepID=UPI001BD01067|nr:DEAD/DEAH box helicase family protein [Wohlfahrtiimonas chitiniclastica]MBS7821515.1 type I restriction endonuclease subunit R [Wohlfahrtiimonas chitiniclastica]
MDKAKESTFQNDIINEMRAHGWQLGSPKNYNRERALYEEDLIAFVQKTQPKEWEKFCALYPINSEDHFCDVVVKQLKKADINATNAASRKFGTLGVLRHGVKSRNTHFFLCQFKPENHLNPEVQANYEHNILRIVPELVYSPHTKIDVDRLDQKSAKKWRIDLVLFLNGLPIVTMELKSEFKQAIDNAINQYKTTRFAKDPATNKDEPLLMFKRGALVHFAVSQYEVYMATHLKGADTYFLPFNKGTKEGGAGNDQPQDVNQYATDYLWNDVLTKDHLLNIIGHFIHLQIEDKENWDGIKYKQESLIFPRFHQWDVVTKLINSAKSEGTGQKYLIQHSAGSGKSNSIAWTAHQLSKLTNDDGSKLFDSVIVVTDRTVLDSQLQDTIYQFEHADGVVEPINNKVGQGSKSEKLAHALTHAKPIIIVTIQTFPFVLKAIEDDVSLKARHYAIIADEAHSSQTGSTASELKKVLMTDGETEDLSSEDMINASLAAKGENKNLSYYAFTATPKTKTLELFGRVPNPALPPSKDNKPEAFHVYSMRQAIEEGFILDVLKNYTNYKVIYQLRQKLEAIDESVDEKKAKVKLNQWVRLHEHNISQKVKVIIEHFKAHIAHLLGGQAKAMVVTSSRKEAVRYKLAFDKYIAENSYPNLAAMVAFSGEVIFDANDADSGHLIGEKFTEFNMNPNLKGREMRKAFDSDDFQVMIVANKFQTGFDQPKLCAMYVDKKLGGVECVQTLSRLNRTYPGKAESGTFILDFFNEPEEILAAFQPYYQTASLEDVTDPDSIFDLADKIRMANIFTWTEVEQFIDAFFTENKTAAAISNICKPAVDRWRKQYEQAIEAYQTSLEMLKRTKATQDPVLIANAENDLATTKIEKDRLEIFKKDLGTYVRTYEFLSQIVDYDDPELEKLSLYARHLRPMLREQIIEEDEINLSNVEMSHYRLSKIREQNIKLIKDEVIELPVGGEAGTGRAKDKKEEFLSVILSKLNEVFSADHLTEKDMINYAVTIADKVAENSNVITQIKNNTLEHAILGDFPAATYDAIFASSEAHKEQMMQLLADEETMKLFQKIVFDLLVGERN